MRLKVLKSKLHLATITRSELYYHGSLTIDPELMEAVGLYPYELILLSNVSTGQRRNLRPARQARDAADRVERGDGAHRGCRRSSDRHGFRRPRSRRARGPSSPGGGARRREPDHRAHRVRRLSMSNNGNRSVPPFGPAIAGRGGRTDGRSSYVAGNPAPGASATAASAPPAASASRTGIPSRSDYSTRSSATAHPAASVRIAARLGTTAT